MSTFKEKLAKTPKAALRCSAPAEILTVDNGAGTKTIKVNLKARSKLGINHWFWGNLYHDFTGMSHRGKVTIDHNHETPIGWANKFDVTDFGLELSGVVVKHHDNPQHASNDVAYQLENGIPLEASIDFSDPDMEIEQLRDENTTAQCNGVTVAGPGCIIRKWQLRAVAICEEGYDKHTSTEALASGEIDLSARLCNDDKPPVETEEKAAEAVPVQEPEAPAAPEPTPAVEATPAPAPVEGEPEAAAEGAPAPVEAPPAPAEELAQLPPEVATLTAANVALAQQVAELTAERDTLAARLAALAGGTPPVPRSEPPPVKREVRLTYEQQAAQRFAALKK